MTALQVARLLESRMADYIRSVNVVRIIRDSYSVSTGKATNTESTFEVKAILVEKNNAAVDNTLRNNDSRTMIVLKTNAKDDMYINEGDKLSFPDSQYNVNNFYEGEKRGQNTSTYRVNRVKEHRIKGKIAAFEVDIGR